MADDTIDHTAVIPAPPAETAKQTEEEFIDIAMKCGAATAYVKKISGKWHMVAEFPVDEIEGLAHYSKQWDLPTLCSVKKAGGSA